MAADSSFQGGSLDASYLNIGEVAIDRKGRIVIATQRDYDPYDIVVARFLANGARDTDYHGSGIVTLKLRTPLAERVMSLGLDEQNRIWIGGFAGIQSDASDPPTSALLLRLSEDGYLDTSFNPSGETAGVLVFRPRGEPTGPVDGGIKGASVDAIAFAGSGALITGRPSGFIDRVLEDGSFDPSFGSSDQGFTGKARVLGKTLFVLNNATVAAFDLDGKPRTSFGSNGKVELESIRLSDIVALADGRLLVIGVGSLTTLARLSADGKLDQSFGDKGYLAANDCIAQTVAVACDGRILTAGYDIQTNPLPYRYCAMAFSPDGTMPASAPAGGMYTWDAPENFPSTVWVRFDPAGKIEIAVKPGNSVLNLERYNPPWSTP